MTADPFTELCEALALGHELAAMIDTVARGRAADELRSAADWCDAAAETWGRGSSNTAHAGYLMRNELRDRADALSTEEADA